MSTYLCVGYEAYVREVDEALTTKFWQYLTLYVKSTLNTQNVYDFGSYVSGSLGTFWTAATADTTAVPANPAQGITTATTAGAIATAAIGVLAQINVLQENFLLVQSPFIESRSQIGGPSLLQFTSAAISSSASPTATVTGLLSTDTVVSVTQATANANSLVPIAFGSPASNALPLTYSGACGTGGTVSVGVLRSNAAPSAGQYAVALSNNMASLTLASGEAPTTTTAFIFSWDLAPGNHGIKTPLVYF